MTERSKPKNATPESFAQYIKAFPPSVQAILKKIRATILAAAPAAEERISYRMQAFFLDGALIYFAAFKQHIGLYPPVKGDEKLQKALAPYRGQKGNLKFSLDEPISYALIKRVVRARVKENRLKAASRPARRKRRLT